MCNKDLRDIASYWGASYSAQITVTIKRENVSEHRGYVDSFVLGNLPQETLIWQDFKLHLRPLSALTDDELTHCAELEAEVEPSYGTVTETDRAQGNTVRAVYNHKTSVELNLETLIGEHGSPYRIGGIVAYLQSISVYVPGTINPTYVQLIES
jgi:hypothetical protein